MNGERHAATDRIVDRSRIERSREGDDLGEQIHGVILAQPAGTVLAQPAQRVSAMCVSSSTPY